MKSLILGTDSKLLNHINEIKSLMINNLNNEKETHLSNLLNSYGHLLRSVEKSEISRRYSDVTNEICAIVKHKNTLNFESIYDRASTLEYKFLDDLSNKGILAKHTPVLNLNSALSKVTKGYLELSFKKHYEILWPLSLQTCGWGSIEWHKFLDAQAEKFTRSKWVFKFFWTIYKAYSSVQEFVTNSNFHSCYSLDEDHLNDFTKEWLLDRCKYNRIKLKSTLSLRKLIEKVERWSHFFSIDEPENFVMTNFSFAGSLHSIKTYPYKITLHKPAMYFLSHFKEECEAGIISTHPEEIHQETEIQLWLEFVFREFKGFSIHSSDKFYLPEQKITVKIYE